DVGNIVDGTLAEGFQTRFQPIGRWADLHATDAPAAIPRAQIGIRNRDRDRAFGIHVRFPHLERQVAQFDAVDRAQFTRNAEMAETVRTIGRDVDVEYRIAAGVLETFQRKPDMR